MEDMREAKNLLTERDRVKMSLEQDLQKVDRGLYNREDLDEIEAQL